jgi:hypothetical protein
MSPSGDEQQKVLAGSGARRQHRAPRGGTGMRRLFRVLLVLYVVYLVGCVWVMASDVQTGGPYGDLGKAMGAIAAGLPWTLLAFVIYPANAGPKLLYVMAAVAAMFNLGALAHLAGWLRFRRSP